jgi:SAM-dependent methyltransferase
MPTADDLVEMLSDLYQRQLQVARPEHRGYLTEHAQPCTIRGQVRAFQWYAPFLPEQGSVLDWGCNHAPDSCLIRATFGDDLKLHGCDFRDPGSFPIFDDFSGIEYTRLNHHIDLPYADGAFDAVIGSGCLEHVAMDYESLKEIYRVLKPDGLLVITYLPNRWSYQEFLRRAVYRSSFHRRLYGIGETGQLLKRTGFYPIVPVAPMSFSLRLWLEKALRHKRLARLLEITLRRLVPVHRICSTLCTIVRKVSSM